MATRAMQGMFIFIFAPLYSLRNGFDYFLKKHFPEIWNEIDRFRTKMMFENITKVIEQGKQEGLFIDYPTSIIMTILVISVRSIVNPDFILNNSFSIVDGARFTFKIIIGGILTEKGKKVFNRTINKI